MKDEKVGLKKIFLDNRQDILVRYFRVNLITMEFTVKNRLWMFIKTAALVASSSLCFNAHAQSKWEPTKNVEFIVPAGTGGGADQMARFLQGVITKHKLMAQPLVVVNKSGGAGAEGFLDAKGARPDGHKIIITLSNLFTTPLATGVPFNWKDLTPVAMLALDEFVLWVNAESPYKSVGDLTKAMKQAGSGKFKMGGTGSKPRRPDHHRRH